MSFRDSNLNQLQDEQFCNWLDDTRAQYDEISHPAKIAKRKPKKEKLSEREELLQCAANYKPDPNVKSEPVWSLIPI